MKPTIALLVRHNEQRYTVNPDYVHALQSAGATVLLVPPQSFEDLSTLLEKVDGLCIPGGEDVNPYLYHQPNTDSHSISAEIETLDMDAFKFAHAHKMPILGICRGLQIINVAMGGSLIQDIPRYLPQALDHAYSQRHHAPLNGHQIFINQDSKLFQVLGSEMEVNSYHHQAIDELAIGLRAVAFSYDDIIEAIEGPGILAVQWHPERMTSLKSTQALFKQFVDACSTYASKN